MFKVHVKRNPDVELSIVSEDGEVRLTLVQCLKEFTMVFNYEDTLIRTQVLGRIECGPNDNDYWIVYLGIALKNSEGRQLDAEQALAVARNIRDALSVYHPFSEGPVTDVHFDMSEWDGWRGRNSAVVKGDSL
jgi:hypothetical protein